MAGKMKVPIRIHFTISCIKFSAEIKNLKSFWNRMSFTFWQEKWGIRKKNLGNLSKTVSFFKSFLKILKWIKSMTLNMTNQKVNSKVKIQTC